MSFEKKNTINSFMYMNIRSSGGKTYKKLKQVYIDTRDYKLKR